MPFHSESKMTARQYSIHKHISQNTVRQWVKRGKLHHCGKAGRAHVYRYADLEAASVPRAPGRPRVP